MESATRSSEKPPATERRSSSFRRGEACSSLAGLLAVLAVLCGCGCGREAPAAPEAQHAAAPAAADDFAALPASTSGGGGPAPGSARSADELRDGEDAALCRALLDLRCDDEAAVYRFLERQGAGTPPKSSETVARLNERLCGLAKDKDASTRRAALAVLARVVPERLGADPFSPALGDASPDVRRQAVIGCARHGIDRRWRLLVPLAADGDARVRAAVAVALAPVEQPEARLTVARMFDDPDDDVVEAAAEALGRRVDSIALGEVVHAAGSSRSRVRRAAAEALSAARRDDLLPYLVKLGADPVWDVRREAIRGLGGFSSEASARALEALEAVAFDRTAARSDRFEAIQSLASTSDACRPRSLRPVAAEDPDPVLRLVAARTELARSDIDGFAHLADLLDVQIGPQADDEDCEFVRATALRTLREVSGRSAGAGRAAWRELLPSIAERFVKSPLDYAPERLVEFW